MLLAAVTAASAAGDPYAFVLGSIPSPGSNKLGPFNMYGLMIAIGVIAAVELGRVRWRARGGDPDDVYAIAFWAVPAGLIGARLYHVITDWNSRYADHLGDIVKVWNGGLGIPGGVALGTAVGVWVAHRRGIRISVGLDVLIPGIPLAQAIGRLGNWWNQELFGGPTSLPWAVRIDVDNRPLEYVGSATFHPTFLYELLWNLALCGLLLWIDRTRRLRPGNVLPLYVGGYFLGRLWIEAMRVDPATEILGIRVNIWLSIVGIGGALVALVARGLWRRPDDSEEPYLDGHRWSDPRDHGDDAPGATADGSVDTETDSDAEVDVVGVDDIDDADGTTDGDAAGVSDEPAEGPPPT